MRIMNPGTKKWCWWLHRYLIYITGNTFEDFGGERLHLTDEEICMLRDKP